MHGTPDNFISVPIGAICISKHKATIAEKLAWRGRHVI